MFAKFFIDRPIFAWVIAIIILLGGALALRELPVAAYPEVAPPAISVNISYPGASAKVVEDTTVALIEEQLSGIEHLLYMESSSELGRATITLTFDSGTNLDVASVDAQNRIKSVEARLPSEVQRAGITVRKSARNYLMFILLISPDQSKALVVCWMDDDLAEIDVKTLKVTKKIPVGASPRGFGQFIAPDAK